MTWWRVRVAVVFLVMAGLGVGCAGYRVGPTDGSRAGSRSVQVQLFQNQTAEPRLSEAVAAALRRGLQRDGTLRVETQGGGDLIVRGVLRQYDRSSLTYQPRDLLTARDFQLILTARVTATERLSGKVVLDREVQGKTTIRLLADQASTERQALPLLAEDLARNITSLLVEGSW